MNHSLPEHVKYTLKNCGWQQCTICNTWCAIITNGICGQRCAQIKKISSNRPTHKSDQKNLITSGLSQK